MNTQKTVRRWLLEDAERWDPPATLLRDVVAIPGRATKPTSAWSGRVVLVLAAILLLLGILASAVLLGAFNDRRFESIIQSPSPARSLVADVETPRASIDALSLSPTATQSEREVASPTVQAGVPGPLTSSNSLALAWNDAGSCRIGSGRAVISGWFIRVPGVCWTSGGADVIWENDGTPPNMYWYPNGWIPDITLVAVVNGDGQEFFVGNYKNGDGPITGEIGFGGRLSINALPVSGPSAAASSAAFVRSNFVGFVVVGEESIAGPGNQTNGATWSSLTGGVGSWQEHAGPPDAKSLVDIVPSNEEYLVAGYLSSDNSPAIWLYDATGWSGEVTLSGGTPNGSLTLIDDDTAIDASHIWTSLSNGHPVIHSLPSGYTFRSATRLQDGYVALGTSVQGPQNDVIMVSADATNWNAAADNPDYDKYPMQSIVSSFEGVVGLGRAVFQGPNSIAAFQLASP